MGAVILAGSKTSRLLFKFIGNLLTVGVPALLLIVAVLVEIDGWLNDRQRFDLDHGFDFLQERRVKSIVGKKNFILLTNRAMIIDAGCVVEILVPDHEDIELVIRDMAFLLALDVRAGGVRVHIDVAVTVVVQVIKVGMLKVPAAIFLLVDLHRSSGDRLRIDCDIIDFPAILDGAGKTMPADLGVILVQQSELFVPGIGREVDMNGFLCGRLDGGCLFIRVRFGHGLRLLSVHFITDDLHGFLECDIGAVLRADDLVTAENQLLSNTTHGPGLGQGHIGCALLRDGQGSDIIMVALGICKIACITAQAADKSDMRVIDIVRSNRIHGIIGFHSTDTGISVDSVSGGHLDREPMINKDSAVERSHLIVRIRVIDFMRAAADTGITIENIRVVQYIRIDHVLIITGEGGEHRVLDIAAAAADIVDTESAAAQVIIDFLAKLIRIGFTKVGNPCVVLCNAAKLIGDAALVVLDLLFSVLDTAGSGTDLIRLCVDGDLLGGRTILDHIVSILSDKGSRGGPEIFARCCVIFLTDLVDQLKQRVFIGLKLLFALEQPGQEHGDGTDHTKPDRIAGTDCLVNIHDGHALIGQDKDLAVLRGDIVFEPGHAGNVTGNRERNRCEVKELRIRITVMAVIKMKRFRSGGNHAHPDGLEDEQIITADGTILVTGEPPLHGAFKRFR
nr:MAG TPA: hypothetical protein [Caudoviricetes sp.]